MANPASAATDGDSTQVYRARRLNAPEGVTLLRGAYATPRSSGQAPDLEVVPRGAEEYVLAPVRANRGISLNYRLSDLRSVLKGKHWAFYGAGKTALLQVDSNFQLTSQGSHCSLSPVTTVPKSAFDAALERAEQLFQPVPAAAADMTAESTRFPPPAEQSLFTVALLWAADGHQELANGREAALYLADLAMAYHDLDPAALELHLTALHDEDRHLASCAFLDFSKKFCLDEDADIVADPHGAVALVMQSEHLWILWLIQQLRSLAQTHAIVCPWAATLTASAVADALRAQDVILNDTLAKAAVKECGVGEEPSVAALVARVKTLSTAPPPPSPFFPTAGPSVKRPQRSPSPPAPSHAID